MTAVQWLIEQLEERGHIIPDHIEETSLIIEKQQIINALNEFSDETLSDEFCIKYINKTYGSKGSDDQVPDVRKMVEDDNYLTPVDWLMDRIKWIHRETYDYLIKEGQYDVAKRTENAILNKANELQSSQTEISDEEIEKKLDKETSIEWLIKELKLEGYDHTIKVAKKMYDKEIDECSKKHSIQKINPSDFIDEMFKNAGRRD